MREKKSTRCIFDNKSDGNRVIKLTLYDASQVDGCKWVDLGEGQI